MLTRCLMMVHAHPDDEASKGAGTVARYHSDGVRTVLVTCTGGEEGDILNPAMDRPDVRDRLSEIRRQELELAAGIIGYDEIVMLGYRDSGMPGTPANTDPRSFAAAPLQEAVGRLVAAIRSQRPNVIVTYPREQSRYPHPDHLRVNEISELAFDAAGDPDRYPRAGTPWQPARLCYVHWSVRRQLAMHQKYVELQLESPYSDERLEHLRTMEEEERAGRDPELRRVVVDISDHAAVVREALLAHATQIDPTSRAWFGLPPEVADRAYPYEEYEIARDLTVTGPSTDDLLSGVETVVAGASLRG